MNETERQKQAFLKAIEESPEDNGLRQIFGDWLDDQGDHDEADRQHRYMASLHWLQAFADSHREDFYEFAQLMEFLSLHVADDDEYRSLGWDTPYDFNDYSDEMWDHYYVVTGDRPAEQWRREKPPISCAC